jgi:hypothetical protein
MIKLDFYATNADMANIHVLKRLLPNYKLSDILGDALRALREKLESQPPREPVQQSAADSTRDLFGD